MPAILLPTDGVVGKLDANQQLKLKEMWRELFRLTEEAPRIGRGVVEKIESPGPPKVRSFYFERDRVSLTFFDTERR